MFDRYSEASQQVLQLAQHHARNLGHPSVSTGHLLLGLTEEAAGATAKRLAERGITAETIIAAESFPVAGSPRRARLMPRNKALPFTDAARDLLLRAGEDAEETETLITPQILLGLVATPPPPGTAEEVGAAIDVLFELGYPLSRPGTSVIDDGAAPRGSGSPSRAGAAAGMPARASANRERPIVRNTPSRQPRFKVVQFDAAIEDADLEAELMALHRDGWEPIGFANAGAVRMRVVLRRTS